MRTYSVDNLITASHIMRKIREANPAAAEAILKSEHKDWIRTEEKKNTLSREFFRSLFSGLFKSRTVSADIEPDTENHRIYAIYCHDLCRAIHNYCLENPLILEDIYLNNDERDLIQIARRSPIRWVEEPPALPEPSRVDDLHNVIDIPLTKAGMTLH